MSRLVTTLGSAVGYCEKLNISFSTALLVKKGILNGNSTRLPFMFSFYIIKFKINGNERHRPSCKIYLNQSKRFKGILNL